MLGAARSTLGFAARVGGLGILVNKTNTRLALQRLGLDVDLGARETACATAGAADHTRLVFRPLWSARIAYGLGAATNENESGATDQREKSLHGPGVS